MKNLHSNICSLRLSLLLAGTITLSACGEASGPTREQLVAEFPSVERDSTRPENPEILCPFVRMLERSGLFDETLEDQETLEVSTTELTAAAEVFGCAPWSVARWLPP